MTEHVTDSGLTINEVEIGEGALAEAGKEVIVHYIGALADGSVFDSSVEHKQPFHFVLGEGKVIKGWDEGVMGMKVGGKRKLVIPPELAYGERDIAGVIPANSTLYFEVELLKVFTEDPVVKMEELAEGEGAEVEHGDKVSMHYTGWLTNGRQFDSSLPRKQPFEFTLGKGMVIKGWDQGILGMKVGGKRKLVIPPRLGYGSARAGGGAIPANSTLIFEVELLKIYDK